MYRSVDRGEVWDPVTVSLQVDVLAVSPQTSLTLYASTTPSAGSTTSSLHRSDDGGRSWSVIPAPPGNPNRHHSMDEPFTTKVIDLAVDLRDHQALCVATRLDGLYRTTNSGESWDFFNPGLPLFRGAGNPTYAERLPRFFTLPAAPDLLYLATDWGLCRITLPAVPEAVPDLDTTETSPSAWTSTGPSALLYGGFNLGIAVSALVVDPHDPHVLYASTTAGGVAKSEDSGKEWRTVAFGQASGLALDWQDPQQLYALIDSALYHSDDQGERWYPLPLGLEHRPLTALALDWQHSSTLYVAGRGQVFRSTNRGASWEKLATGLPCPPPPPWTRASPTPLIYKRPVVFLKVVPPRAFQKVVPEVLTV